MTREQVEKRLEALKLQQQQLVAQANAVAGAIQMCEDFLKDDEPPAGGADIEK